MRKDFFIFLFLFSLCGVPLLAHEGEQHAEPNIMAVPLPGEGLQSQSASSEFFELVVKHGELKSNTKVPARVYLSDFATNAPIAKAEINLTLPGVIEKPIPVEPTEAAGVYRFDFPALKEGSYDLLFEISAETSDLIPLTGFQVTERIVWKEMAKKGFSTLKKGWPLILFFAVLLVLRKRILAIVSRVKSNWLKSSVKKLLLALCISLGISLALSTASSAHEGESHGGEELASTSEATVRDKIHLPKESQFLLGLRTLRLERREVQKRVQALGKVLPRPQTSADVFSMQEGIILPSSDTNFVLPGRKVRKGEVLAVIQSIGSFEVRAPISGTVTEVLFTRGQHVEHDKKLLTIIDFSRLWVEANVYEADLPKLKKGKTALIQSESFPETSFEGTLINLGQVIDPATQAAKAIFEVRNRGELLRVGMFVQVALDTGEKAQEILIPESAIVERGDKKFVFIHTLPEEFISREITLGEKIEGHWMIRKGLQEGERVVTQGNYQLSSMGEKKL